MRTRMVSFLAVVAILFSQSSFASTMASPEQDRQAKQATPAPGKALVYVYRLDDGETESTPGIWLNGRASGSLAPRTYGMWAAGSGRLDIRAGSADAKPFSFTCEAGRVYFVQLSVNKDRSVNLRQVAYGVGRTDLQQARLVLDPALAARAATPAKQVPATAPSPTPVVKQSPVVREAPKVAKPASKPRVVTDEDEQDQAASGVTLIFKLGQFTLASESQTILGNSRSFSATNVAYGAEGEWRFQNGFALGIEFMGHSQEYSTTGFAGSGEMAVTSLLFNAKKYFRPSKVVQPYIGLGLGSTVTDFSPGDGGAVGITGSAVGFAFQGMTGVAFRWRHLGIYSEIKYVSAETEGTDAITGNKETVDASGIGLFGGFNVQF